MGERRLVLHKKEMTIKEGEYEGWQFTAITNPPMRVLEELTGSTLDSVIGGLAKILVAPWNFCDTEGELMKDPSVETIKDLPIDLISAISTTYISETTSVPQK